MKNMKRLFFVIFLIICILVIFNGCDYENMKMDKSNVNDSYDVAKKYLENKHYNIISYEESKTYVLTKQKLVETYYMQQWIMQKEQPDKYIGKEIFVENFIVKNHPLDNWSSHSRNKEHEVKALGKVNVSVFVVDNKVIGGISNPVTDALVYGGFYSLNGKNFEDIHSIEFPEFREEWFLKYRE